MEGSGSRMGTSLLIISLGAPTTEDDYTLKGCDFSEPYFLNWEPKCKIRLRKVAPHLNEAASYKGARFLRLITPLGLGDRSIKTSSFVQWYAEVGCMTSER